LRFAEGGHPKFSITIPFELHRQLKRLLMAYRIKQYEYPYDLQTKYAKKSHFASATAKYLRRGSDSKVATEICWQMCKKTGELFVDTKLQLTPDKLDSNKLLRCFVCGKPTNHTTTDTWVMKQVTACPECAQRIVF
jgi:hypothetical protein